MMNKYVKMFLLLLFLSALFVNCAMAITYPCEGRIIKSAVNVRKQANQGSDQVGKLKRDEIVVVIGEKTSGNTVWYEIEFGKGKTGYVREDLITLGDTITGIGATIENNPSSENTIVNSYEKDRKKPSTGAGGFVDLVIEYLEDTLKEDMEAGVPISNEYIFGDSGSLYIDLDKYEIRLKGNNNYITCSYGQNDWRFNRMAVSTTLVMAEAPDEKKVIVVKEGQANLLDEETLARFTAQLSVMLQNYQNN